jgi:tetratricopeptide (TPR) repeat protein
VRFSEFIAHAKARKVLYIRLLLLFVIGALSNIYTFDIKVNTDSDSAVSFLLGKALARGDGYCESWTSMNTPHTQHPPLYPAIISCVCRLTHERDYTSIYITKYLNGVVCIASICLFFFVLLRLSVEAELAVISCVFLCINANFLAFASTTTSDMLFLFCLLLFMYSIVRLDTATKAGDRFWIYLAILSGTALVYTRTAGLALIYAVAIYLVMRKRRMHFIAIFVPVYFLAVLWAVRGALAGNNPFAPGLGDVHGWDVIKSMAQNMAAYISNIAMGSVLPFLGDKSYLPPLVQSIISRGAIAVTAYGVIKHRQSRLLILICLTFYVADLSFHPGAWTDVRVFFPLIPWVTYFFIRGLNEVITRIPDYYKSFPRIKPYWILIAGILCFPNLDQLRIKATNPYPARWKNLIQMAAWAEKNTPRDAVIYSSKPALFSLVSGRLVAGQTIPENAHELLQNVEKQKVGYVAVDQPGEPSQNDWISAVDNYPAAFHKVFEIANPRTSLFEVVSYKNAATNTTTLMLGAYGDLEKGAGLLDEKKYREAGLLFEKGINTLLHSPFACDDEIAAAYNNLAVSCQYQNEELAAEHYYSKVLDIVTALHGTPHPKVAIALFNLGMLYESFGVLGKAENYYDRSLQMRYRISKGSVDRDIAITLTELGGVLRKEKRTKEAKDCLEKAIDAWKKCTPEKRDNDMTIAAMEDLTQVLDSLGEKENARGLKELIFILRNHIESE